MRSATFRNVAIGILALAAAYHFGASTARSSEMGRIVGFTAFAQDYYVVATEEGDVYQIVVSGGATFLQRMGNVWTGSGATPTGTHSLGQIMARYAR